MYKGDALKMKWLKPKKKKKKKRAWKCQKLVRPLSLAWFHNNLVWLWLYSDSLPSSAPSKCYQKPDTHQFQSRWPDTNGRYTKEAPQFNSSHFVFPNKKKKKKRKKKKEKNSIACISSNLEVQFLSMSIVI